MKRIIIIPAVLFIFVSFFSCNQADYLYNFVIINKSSVPVSYFIYDTPYIIEAGISEDEPSVISHDRAYYDAINNITCDGYGVKVKGTHKYINNYTAIEYTFYDVEPYNLEVFNTLPVSVTITADNFIDDNGSAELTVMEGEIKSAKIYTKKPVFTVIDPLHPINVDWEFVVEPYTVTEEDPETGEEIEVEYKNEFVYVTIR